MSKTLAARQVKAIQIELEVPIEASRESVWESLIQDIGRWWHPDFYATRQPTRIILEASPGGRLYEESEEGEGLLWYTVTAVSPQSSINLAGHLAPPYGGPATSLLRLGLEAKGDSQTILTISDSIVGVVADDSCIEEGWRALFSDGLKRYIESRK